MIENETIIKVNAIISVVTELTEEDVTNLLAAKERIEEKIKNSGQDDLDTVGITRLDSILAIYSTLEKES